jgi:alpha-mannosidase/mannosylglycerate hydrolase
MTPPAKLYIVTAWERDGLATFETSRARLLDALEEFSRRVYADAPQRLLTGGETMLLDDVAELRPDLQTMLAVYNVGGRLTLGPWYAQPVTMLVSGEALVRNLLAARSDAHHYGTYLAQAAYMPMSSGYPAQLPQVLRDFHIDTLVAAHGGLPSLFRWQGADGSTLLVINLDNDRQSVVGGLGLRVFSLSANVHHGDHGGLEAFIHVLKDVPDSMRPVAEGELYRQTGAPGDYRLPGMLSARLHIKQTYARLQQHLTYAAEPLLALALTHGQPKNPDNLRALLGHSWQILLRYQSALDGTASDAAHAEHEFRARQVTDAAAHVVEQALNALPGELAIAPSAASETYIVVWNPHNWQAQQPVEVRVPLAEGHYPMRLLDVEDREVPYAWADGVLYFVADAPPVGYTTYTLQLTLDSASLDQPTRTAGQSISSAADDSRLLIIDDRLIWRHLDPSVIDKDGQTIRAEQVVDRSANLLQFFDGGDAGDVFNYSPPRPDLVVPAGLMTNIEIETTRIYQRLILTHRLRLTPALNEQRGRLRGVKSLDLLTTATLYHHLPGVYFRTSFENTIKDHRLRAHLRTGLKSETVLADSAFGLARRPVGDGSITLPDEPRREGIIHTQPMQTVCAVDDGKEAMALLTRGLPEYEAIAEDGQVTLALTLLRAVGWRVRSDLRARTAPVGVPMAVPEAQCLREMTAEYALRILPSGDPASVLRAGQLFSAPLQAFVYEEHPPAPVQSYITIEGDGLVMTALKPPQVGAGWIVRLLNPTAQRIDARLHTVSALQSAQVVSMGEEHRADLQIHESRSVDVSLKPQQVLTLRLDF